MWIADTYHRLQVPKKARPKSRLSFMPWERWISTSSKTRRRRKYVLCYTIWTIFLQCQINVLGDRAWLPSVKRIRESCCSWPCWILNKRAFYSGAEIPKDRKGLRYRHEMAMITIAQKLSWAPKRRQQEWPKWRSQWYRRAYSDSRICRERKLP